METIGNRLPAGKVLNGCDKTPCVYRLLRTKHAVPFALGHACPVFFC
ncbi:hypothetical protein BSPP4475_04905 [Brevibacillus aydinogluensis]|uniref:Uncharacterized protein n=1 Tax=Brevibacillus aydinogluensis TaxID=927786 RepID=A0AA48M7D5_9BACL|nr:hypothetical protein BSPP4475_04905 [Brevibacillus aydinogluensis]